METFEQKRHRILNTERHHELAPPLNVALDIPVVSPPGEPIDTPFHLELADHSKWFAPRGQTPSIVVIHCTGATNPAKSTADFFASSTASGSTQSVADDNTGFTCVPDDAVCAGAPPLNQEGLHIEQPGLSTWSRAEWLSHMDEIRRVAFKVAHWCKTYDIPVRLLRTADLTNENVRGITAHMWVSARWHQSTHEDPGPNYPWDVFIPLVEEFFNGGGDMALTDLQADYVIGMIQFNKGLNAPAASASEATKNGYADSKQHFINAMTNPKPGPGGDPVPVVLGSDEFKAHHHSGKESGPVVP